MLSSHDFLPNTNEIAQAFHETAFLDDPRRTFSIQESNSGQRYIVVPVTLQCDEVQCDDLLVASKSSNIFFQLVMYSALRSSQLMLS